MYVDDEPYSGWVSVTEMELEELREKESKLEEVEDLLKKFLPMYYYDSQENEHYIGGSFEYNEHDDPVMLEVMRYFGYEGMIDNE